MYSILCSGKPLEVKETSRLEENLRNNSDRTLMKKCLPESLAKILVFDLFILAFCSFLLKRLPEGFDLVPVSRMSYELHYSCN